jgi:hypothetical protein
MYARSTSVHGDPRRLEEAIAFVGQKEFPAITGIPGCVGLSMLADRKTGRCIVSSAWADEETLTASAEAVRTTMRFGSSGNSNARQVLTTSTT